MAAFPRVEKRGPAEVYRALDVSSRLQAAFPEAIRSWPPHRQILFLRELAIELAKRELGTEIGTELEYFHGAK